MDRLIEPSRWHEALVRVISWRLKSDSEPMAQGTGWRNSTDDLNQTQALLVCHKQVLKKPINASNQYNT